MSDFLNKYKGGLGVKLGDEKKNKEFEREKEKINQQIEEEEMLKLRKIIRNFQNLLKKKTMNN